MKILMIDRSAVIDRRIILEAKALIAVGRHVVLISGGKIDSPSMEYIEGIKVIRINLEVFDVMMSSTSKVVSSSASSEEILKKIKYLVNVDDKKIHGQLVPLFKHLCSTQRQEKLMIHLKKWTRSKNISYLIFGIIYPKEMLSLLCYANMPLRKKKSLFLFFSLLTLSPRRIAKASIQFFRLDKFFEKNDDEPSYFFPKKDLFPAVDSWERNVMFFVKKALFEPDVIHAHDYPSLKVSANLANYFSIPLIYDSHELYSYQPGLPKSISRAIFSEEKKLIKHCHSVIVVNDEMIKIMEKDFDFHRFVAVSNATEQPKDFDAAKKYNLIREKLNLPENSKILIFQGGINRIRKIDLLLEGLSKTPKDIHIVFLTFSSHIPEFKQLAQELGIQDRTHFFDYVPWNEVLYWVASADAGMMPYHPSDLNTRISSPNKMYEFIVAGIPMIAHSGLINVHKVITEEGFGISCILEKPEDYAQAIMDMFDNSQGGHLRFRKNLLTRRHAYEWKQEATKLINLYANLQKENKKHEPLKEMSDATV